MSVPGMSRRIGRRTYPLSLHCCFQPLHSALPPATDNQYSNQFRGADNQPKEGRAGQCGNDGGAIT
eukprot:2883529-Rhodomonas_salina.1